MIVTEKFENVEAVDRMQVYIKENLTDEITLVGLARAAGYSPFHSARLFKEMLGVTPFEYIRRLRLSESALRLRDEDVRVLDVALDFMFGTHEGFTRAFAKEFGVRPKEYAKRPVPIKLFIPFSVRYYYQYKNRKGDVFMEKSPQAIFVQIMERAARKLILKRGVKAEDYFSYCEEAGCDVWGTLCSVKEALNEPMGMWLPEGMRSNGTSLYVQGVEVPADYSGLVPEGFEIIDLKPCLMMIFQGPPYDDEHFCEAITNLGEQIKLFNPNTYGYEWADEDAPRFQFEPWGYRGYIEGRPVRAIKK